MIIHADVIRNELVYAYEFCRPSGWFRRYRLCFQHSTTDQLETIKGPNGSVRLMYTTSRGTGPCKCDACICEIANVPLTPQPRPWEQEQ